MKVISQIVAGAILLKFIILVTNYFGIRALNNIEIKIRNIANNFAKIIAQKIKETADNAKVGDKQ